MKKVVSISLFAAMGMATMANAEDSIYRIYVGMFGGNRDEVAIERVTSIIKAKIGDSAKFDVIDSYITDAQQKVLYVDTKPASRAQADALAAEVKQATGYNDIFVKPKVGTNPVAKVDTLVMAQESMQTPVVEPATQTAEVQEPAVSGILTIREAAQKVLAENPKIKESEYNYFKVGKDLKIAKSAYYPTLDLQGSVGYERRAQDEGFRQPRKSGDGRISNASLTLVENLYNGGADKNRINSQSARLDSAAYTINQTADRLILQLANAYLELLHTKKIVDIETETVASHERIYNQIKDRAASGFGVASEERQAGSRYTLAQSNLIAAQNNYEDAITTFEKLYGQKVDADSLVMPDFNLPLPNSEMELQDKALMCNPALLVQRANIAMAESVVKEKNAPFLPKLDLEVSGRYDHSTVLYDNYEDKAFDILLRLRYNLYNKGIDKLDKEKSQLAASQEQQTLDVLTRDLKESLKFTWQNYNLEQKKMAYLNEHVEYAKATLDSYQDEFRIGRRDLINLLDAETEYNTALKEILNTEVAIRYAQYRMLDNMGMLSDSFEPGFGRKYIQGACSIENDLR
ncbi:TolC family outer membrane protein [Campylobacter sp. 9BO]|uniref:TolC family outer membrane protein n=1 Tax=Campylobacter sp. 9BO TaxID=3424759 RepID=UPI003D342324